MNAIISAINAEIAKLQQAKAILSATVQTAPKKKPGRPAKATSFEFGARAVTKPKRRKRKGSGMSPEGRARIAAAQKTRWAKLRKAQKVG